VEEGAVEGAVSHLPSSRQVLRLLLKAIDGFPIDSRTFSGLSRFSTKSTVLCKDMTRRMFINLCGALVSLFSGRLARSQPTSPAAVPIAAATLLSAPLEVQGAWGGSSPNDAATVISRMREACLSGVRLLSDHQPDRLRVDDQASGPPHVWLHSDNPTTAWIVVDIGVRAWSQLAYQFGHELGHVVCNSWMWKVETPPPSRWLEESLAEAFSMRGLGLLAGEWERRPPFPNDSRYAQALRNYRHNLVEKYRNAGSPQGETDLAAWLGTNRALLDGTTGLGNYAGPAILAVLNEMETDPRCVEDLGAVNRWPERSSVPLENYLRLWRTSCEEIGASGHLPERLREVFALR
jgi:hypothetical protein